MANQLGLGLEPDLLHDLPRHPKFLGEGYEPKLDQARLSRHCMAVLGVLRQDARWWTYEALGEASGVPVGSVRTRVSNLRSWGHSIETRTRQDRFREVRLSA